jgi:hypothetical protein
VEALKLNLANKEYNPFEIDLNKPIKCNIPTVFVYSENDEILNPENSKKIIRNFTGHFEKIVIKERHNAMRQKSTILQLVDIIKRHLSKKGPTSESKFKKQNTKRELTENCGIWVSSKFEASNQKYRSVGKKCLTSEQDEDSTLTQSREEPLKPSLRNSLQVYSTKLQKMKEVSKANLDKNALLGGNLEHIPCAKSFERNRLRLSHELYL